MCLVKQHSSTAWVRSNESWNDLVILVPWVLGMSCRCDSAGNQMLQDMSGLTCQPWAWVKALATLTYASYLRRCTASNFIICSILYSLYWAARLKQLKQLWEVLLSSRRSFFSCRLCQKHSDLLSCHTDFTFYNPFTISNLISTNLSRCFFNQSRQDMWASWPADARALNVRPVPATVCGPSWCKCSSNLLPFTLKFFCLVPLRTSPVPGLCFSWYFSVIL